jgi:integrase
MNQVIVRRGRQCGMEVFPHRHHFSHTWLDRGGAEGNLMDLNGWTSPQMLRRRYGASARSARAAAATTESWKTRPDLRPPGL